MDYVNKEALEMSFIDTYIDESNEVEEGQYIGTYRADILFDTNKKAEEKIINLIIDSGYQIDEIEYGVNWAYIGGGSEQNNTIIYTFLFLSLFIMLTGYLIISNIFHISVINDIKFYGLLKTIGVTNKQIRKIILIHGVKVCVSGIPVGLVIGFFVAQLILPIMIFGMFGSTSVISFNPIIFILSTLFVMITVFISCNKPASIAGKVSPIEGFRYVENSHITLKNRDGYKAVKLYRMAFSNLGRNKK